MQGERLHGKILEKPSKICYLSVQLLHIPCRFYPSRTKPARSLLRYQTPSGDPISFTEITRCQSTPNRVPHRRLSTNT